MKRQKRDMKDRPKSRGYQAGVSGRSRDLCPHEQNTVREEWMRGWREGRTDHWDGYAGVASVHKAMSL